MKSPDFAGQRRTIKGKITLLEAQLKQVDAKEALHKTSQVVKAATPKPARKPAASKKKTTAKPAKGK